MAEVFKTGDVVMLKSGGPPLTVREVGNLVDGSGQHVKAAWFQENIFKDASFIGSMLDLVTSAES